MISVLLVEPHEDTRALYGEFLQSVGFRVQALDTTDHASVLAAHADVIVTGLQVPGTLDGFGLIERLRQAPECRRKPIIVLSASADRVNRDRAMAAGCDIFLTKPCLPADLATEVRHAVLERSGPRGMLKAQPDRRRYHPYVGAQRQG